MSGTKEMSWKEKQAHLNQFYRDGYRSLSEQNEKLRKALHTISVGSFDVMNDSGAGIRKVAEDALK